MTKRVVVPDVFHLVRQPFSFSPIIANCETMKNVYCVVYIIHIPKAWCFGAAGT